MRTLISTKNNTIKGNRIFSIKSNTFQVEVRNVHDLEYYLEIRRRIITLNHLLVQPFLY